jgi:AcrR family transcriptional regulator
VQNNHKCQGECEQMVEKKSDRRVRYTKMVIKQALLDLMKEKPINKIKVTEICDRADVGRGSFYTYYENAYDLMEQIEDEIFAEVERSIKESSDASTSSVMLTEIMRYASENVDMCKVLLGPNGDKEFIRRLVNIERDRNVREWQRAEPNTSTLSFELQYVFISSGVVGILESWIADGTKQSPEEIALIIAELVARCLDTNKGTLDT